MVLRDLVLPGSDGIELIRQVPELSDLPVIFISVYRRDETVARALEAGAVDYIAKPFSPTELVARVRAALRRRAKPGPFAVGELAIEYAERRVAVGGEAVELTATEYEPLRVLSLDAGRVVTFDTLLRRVCVKRESADANPVRIFVRNLRRKLGDSVASPAWIFNERGVDYRMARPDAGRWLTARRPRSDQAPPDAALRTVPGFLQAPLLKRMESMHVPLTTGQTQATVRRPPSSATALRASPYRPTLSAEPAAAG